MEINIQKAVQLKEKPTDESGLGFGKALTDHMFLMEYDEGMGWHDARIQPYTKLMIDPASAVLHYAQEIFEGLKAYRTPNNDVQLFRPRDNAVRLNESAHRMVMPEIDPDFNVQAMKKLVDIERDWVPHMEGTSLYLRPTMIADGVELGVHASKRYLYYIICAASGMYYTKGFAPVRIYVEDAYVRAVRGGVGGSKTGGNYAASLRASEEAKEKGFSQVLWLDAVEHKYVQEVGAMNMMFLLGDTVCTAPIDGSILDGITRRSVLQLVNDMGYKVEERPVSIDELYEAGENGLLKEAFGTGTAAIITPVSELFHKGRSLILSGGKIGQLTQKLYDTLIGIQRGAIKDPYGWTVKI